MPQSTGVASGIPRSEANLARTNETTKTSDVALPMRRPSCPRRMKTRRSSEHPRQRTRRRRRLAMRMSPTTKRRWSSQTRSRVPPRFHTPRSTSFKPSTFDIVPKMNVSDADTQRMLDLGCFHRSDLGSALQDTTVSLECRKRKYGYDTHRMCVKGSVNFGCRGPGKAFVLTTGAFDTTHPEHQKVYTVYAGDRNPTDDEPWRPYGKYEYLWCGLANKDEFNNLGAEASLQTEVIDAFMEYLRGNEDKYSVGLFENVFVQLDPTDPALEDAWETRFDAPKPTQRAAIERSLRENNGLQIGYAVLVYAGPMLEEEIRDIVAAREERRAREAPWKVAVEQYEADLQIWKKAAKRAKAKGEAEPPKPERPQKPKKPKKVQTQTKRAGRKGSSRRRRRLRRRSEFRRRPRTRRTSRRTTMRTTRTAFKVRTRAKRRTTRRTRPRSRPAHSLPLHSLHLPSLISLFRAGASKNELQPMTKQRV
ncbi:hypothetical protein AAT19DRAFT_13565 [Rhodotorula toruloides]|uniref:Uncharacterized protein n=1 Tax=Rhodotorula toruloides TaxID=5286 RepID=A0A2T0ABX5_RHOTO|nr:hypothetical protein AAT19DRAFT_13565 [Rhodotorula toruloides]